MTIKLEMTLWEWAKTRSWSGARTNLQYLTIDEIDTLETLIEDWDWTDETQLNDWIWFDIDQILELLEISDKDWEKRKPLRDYFTWSTNPSTMPF